jgi:1-acyl-sn-glycerol-3-phosphate acyltransferase
LGLGKGMSDLMYKWVVRIGYHAFWVSSKPVVLHRDRVANMDGPYILAPNHLSPYDVPCLMAEMPRWKLLDFLSITELFQNRLTAWFLRSVNTFPLDRSRADSPTVRVILNRLANGRIIAMFPEGQFRDASNSVLTGGDVKPGVARLAQLAGVPVVPCVILGTGAYSRPVSWLPLKRVRYGVIYGSPLYVRKDLDEAEARAEFLQALKRAYRSLHAELLAAGGRKEHHAWKLGAPDGARHDARDGARDALSEQAEPHATAAGR